MGWVLRRSDSIALCLRDAAIRSCIGPDFRNHRHSWAQLIEFFPGRLEHDLHRDALYDFREVAGRIVWWKKCELRSAGWSDFSNSAFKYNTRQSVNRDIDRIALAY